MRFIKNRMVLLCAVSLISFKSTKPVKKSKEEIDTLANQYIRSQGNYGLAIGIVNNGQEYTYCFGSSSAERPMAIDSNSVFEIGSITKLFTSLVLAEEVTRGHMALNESFLKYIPASYSNPELGSISLENLASHSSGLPRLAGNFWSTVTDQDDPYKSYGENDLYTFLSGYKMERKPGDTYEYSNVAVGLLGNILSHHNNGTYEELIQRHICESFGMSNTHVRIGKESMSHVATGHTAGYPVKNWDFQDATAGQGALKSTISDMLRFTRNSLYPESSSLAQAIGLTQQEHFNDTRNHMRVGLGWHIGSFDGEKYLEHNGATGGYRSFIGLIPGSKCGVVILSNSDNPVDLLGIEILKVLKLHQAEAKELITSAESKK